MNHLHPQSDLATEKIFPVSDRWIIQHATENMLVLGSLGLIGYYVLKPEADPSIIIALTLFFVLIYILYLLMAIVSRVRFHYRIQAGGFFVTSPWSEERYFPYSVLTKISISQNSSDKIFGLFNLEVKLNRDSGYAPIRHERIGVLGDLIVIPGLSREHAVSLFTLLKRLQPATEQVRAG